MIGPITALTALLASKPHMVVIKGLLPLPHFIAYLPRQRYHLLSLRRIVQDNLRLVLTWTLSKVQADGGLPSAGSRDPQPHAVAEADESGVTAVDG